MSTAEHHGLTGSDAHGTNSGSNAPDGARDVGTPDSLEKVRDILFGAQMREQERRFEHLEERLVREFTLLRDELDRRFETLEGYVKQEIDSLIASLGAEKSERGQMMQTLSRNLEQSSRSLESRIQETRDQGGASERILREQLLHQSQELTEEIRRRYVELKSSIDEETRSLQGSRPDRQMLAGLFTELAMRLASDDHDAR